MERLTFRMKEAFNPDDAIAVWVMNLSIALGDLRVVVEYATRPEQPDYERIYFVRIFASHLREVAKLLVLDYRDREDVRTFVDALPDAARTARGELERLLSSHFELRPEAEVWRDLKRLRDDTFHYARDDASQRRLRAAMATVATMHNGECVSSYTISDDGRLRADYADLVIANRMHPFEQEHEEDQDLPFTRELHEAIIDVNGHAAAFIQAAEAHYLLDVLPDGVVQHHRS